MFTKLEKNTFIDSVKKVAKVSLVGLMFAGAAVFANVTKTEVSTIETSSVQIEKQNNFVLIPSENKDIFAYHSSHSSHASHASHASHCSSSQYPC